MGVWVSFATAWRSLGVAPRTAVLTAVLPVVLVAAVGAALAAVVAVALSPAMPIGAVGRVEVNPGIEVLRVSAKTGEGMPAWYEWLEEHRP